MALHFIALHFSIKNYHQRLCPSSTVAEQRPQNRGGGNKAFISFVSAVLLRVGLGSAGPLCFKQRIQLDLASCFIMDWALFCSVYNSSGAQAEGAESLLMVHGRNAGRQAQ